MRQIQTIAFLTAVLIFSSLVVFAAPARQHGNSSDEQVLTVRKSGEVSFSKETRVGNMVLDAGTYRLEHRVAGSDHFIHFTKMEKLTRRSPEIASEHPGEMKCTVEPLPQKARQTKAVLTKEGNGYRLTRVEIQGENVAHIF